jgi:uncharacterized protein
MIVVADASPLIFLAKLDRLQWLASLFGSMPVVPSSVAAEVLRPPIPPAEERMLTSFLRGSEVVDVPDPQTFARALSRADNEALTLAVERNADLLLADDRLVRSMAVVEQIRPMGTLGIILRAKRSGSTTCGEARELVRALVRQHGFRIGIEVFEAVMAELVGLADPGAGKGCLC